MAYPLLLSKYLNIPLLCSVELLKSASSLLLRDSNPTALSTSKGQKPNDMIEMREDVAILNITGPIFRYGKVDACAVVYGTQHFAEALDTLDRDERVKHIIINFDTGGGEATGVGELAQQIRELSTPTTAYVEGICASAGYWLASACTQIVAHETSYLGSIGVVFMFIDDEKMQKKMGVKSVEIVSTQSPNKRIDYKKAKGYKKIQTQADDLAEIFISNVAKYRKTTSKKVKKNFGKGDVMIAQKSLSAGMIDATGTLEELILKLQQGDNKMARKEEKKAKVFGASALKKSSPTAYNEIMTVGAKQERKRIEAVLNIPHSANYSSIIQAMAFDGKSSESDAIVALHKAKQEFVATTKDEFYAGGEETTEALKNISTLHDGDEKSSKTIVSDALSKSIEKRKRKVK